MSLRTIILCIGFTLVITADTRMNEFQSFLSYMNTYSKTYSSVDEFFNRYQVFKQNLEKRNDTNLADQDTINEGDDLILGVTRFSDLTKEEFKKKYLTFNYDENDHTDVSEVFVSTNYEGVDHAANNSQTTNETNSGRNLQSLPTNFDWRTKNAVTSVRDQGACGSCYSFAAVSNIEGLYYIKYKKVINLSEQQIVDCDSSNGGCNGGNAHKAFIYLINAGGLQLRNSYPYKARKSTCTFKSSLAAVKIKSYVIAGSQNEDHIKNMLYQTGPLAVALNADNLQFYRSGIINYSDWDCNPSQLNHAVTLVGYGVSTTGVNYWIVKNSWGSQWGESGYFRIRRGAGTCGINRYVSSAILA